MKLRTMKTALLLCATALPLAPAAATPKSSTGIAADGVVAYQDSANTRQWHYMPLRTDAAQNFGIKTFSARYWGLGPRWNNCPGGNMANCYSAVGAALGGTISIDISQAQQKSLIRAIAASTGLPQGQIQLLPVKLRNPKIQPVIAANTLEFGANSDQIFPATIDIGSTFAYTIGTGGATFAAVLASGDANSFEITPNPLFGLNISGDVEVVGDPWVGSLSCDLKQVWHEIRKSFSASATWGWFELGKAQYDSLWQDLQKSGACNLQLTQGSIDTDKYGTEMFDMAKRLFEQINAQAAGGTGFFKFEPLPESTAFAPSFGLTRGLFSNRSVKVNASYSEKHFSQKIMWSTRVEYNGRYMMPVSLGVTLAVTCNQATKQLFADAGNTSEPCITQAKVDEFNRRADAERAAKNRAIKDLYDLYLAGKIDDAHYTRALDMLKNMSLTENFAGPLDKVGNDGILQFGNAGSTDERIREFLEKALGK